MTEEIIKLDSAIGKLEDTKIPKQLVDAIDSLILESQYWDAAFRQQTPDNAVEEREGSGGVMFEYIKDSYTIRKLNALYPGWYTDEMKIEYIPNLATFIVTGYLIIEYPTKLGLKRRKIWAVGSSVVQMKTDTTKGVLPSQPDDVAKSAYTEWIKLVGKRIGIGTDIFEQSITDAMKNEYMEKVSCYKYTNITDSYVSLIKSKKKFNAYVDTLPTSEQANELTQLLSDKGLQPEVERQIWEQFQKHQKSTVSTLLKQIKEKLNPNKGDSK